MLRLCWPLLTCAAGFAPVAPRSVVRDEMTIQLPGLEPTDPAAAGGAAASLIQEGQDLQASGRAGLEANASGAPGAPIPKEATANASTIQEEEPDTAAASAAAEDAKTDAQTAEEAAKRAREDSERAEAALQGGGGGDGALFATAENELKRIMTQINVLASTAQKQRVQLSDHRDKIKDFKAKYNKLLLAMDTKLGAMKQTWREMAGGLAMAARANLKGTRYFYQKIEEAQGEGEEKVEAAPDTGELGDPGTKDEILAGDKDEGWHLTAAEDEFIPKEGESPDKGPAIKEFEPDAGAFTVEFDDKGVTTSITGGAAGGDAAAS